MKVIKELFGVKEVYLIDREVLFFTSEAIILETLQIEIPYLYQPGDYIRFYEQFNNEVFVYVGYNHNTAYRIIDSRGVILLDRELTFIGKCGKIVLESNNLQSIFISEQLGVTLTLKKELPKSQIRHFDSNYLVVCNFGDYSTIDIHSSISLEFLVCLDFTTLLNSNLEHNFSDYSIEKVLGICDSKIICLLYSGKIVIYDIKLGVWLKVTYIFNESEESFETHADILKSVNFSILVDLQKNELFGVHGEWHIECSLDTDLICIKLNSIKNELVKSNMDIIDIGQKYNSLDNSMLLSVFRHTNMKNNLGIFDRKRQQILETYSLQVSKNEIDESHCKYIHPSIRTVFDIDNRIYIQFNAKERAVFVLSHS